MARVTRSSIRHDESLPLPNQVKAEPQQLSSPPATPAPKLQRKRGTPKMTTDRTARNASLTPNSAASLESSRKRTHTEIKVENEGEELPHNLGGSPQQQKASLGVGSTTPNKRSKNGRLSALRNEVDLAQAEKIVGKVVQEPKAKKARTKKDTTYGLTAGQTPFPDWPYPTPEECQEVDKLLSKVHGQVKAPKTIPKPSLTASGCGEVPSVLDALIRTRLSAATSGTNSSRAFQGLVDRFGVLKEGVGKGSVNWDAVRRADVSEVFEAIKSGGLAKVKSKDIKEILQTVYEENQARKDSLLSDDAKTPGIKTEPSEDAAHEIAMAESSVISLDHLHLLSDKEAFDKLVKYPGIGPKTASCVLLFCLQRPSFAVDTHVFRLCSWLGWVPPNATRNTAYAHCDVRIPDELKYSLHQLLIKHGKTCPRCRANTSEGYKTWEEGCAIDHLVKRSGARKGGLDNGIMPKKKAPKKGKTDWDTDVEDSSELDEFSDTGSDDM